MRGKFHGRTGLGDSGFNTVKHFLKTLQASAHCESPGEDYFEKPDSLVNRAHFVPCYCDSSLSTHSHLEIKIFSFPGVTAYGSYLGENVFVLK